MARIFFLKNFVENLKILAEYVQNNLLIKFQKIIEVLVCSYSNNFFMKNWLNEESNLHFVVLVGSEFPSAATFPVTYKGHGQGAFPDIVADVVQGGKAMCCSAAADYQNGDGLRAAVNAEHLEPAVAMQIDAAGRGEKIA